MRWLAALVLLVPGAPVNGADDPARAELLVGSYTGGGSQGIYRFVFDSRSGRLAPEPLQVQQASNPSWLVVDENRGRLFAVAEQAPGQVAGFALEPGRHRLASRGQVDSRGSAPTHASLSADGRYLFVANYGDGAPGASLAVLPAGADGTPGAPLQVMRYRGSGANAERQAESHVHSAVPSPDGRHVFASDLGADRVFAYDYRADAQPPLRPATPAKTVLPPGSGPRHLLFSANGRQAWLTLELSAQVVALDVDGATLTPHQWLALDDGDDRTHSAGGLHASADGRFLYVADRGEANQIVVLRIHPDGTLEPLQRRDAEGREPREFVIAPDGRFLLVANQFSGEIVVLRRDPVSGLLGDSVQRLPLDSPSFLHFLSTAPH